jgi:hypothetical protein
MAVRWNQPSSRSAGPFGVGAGSGCLTTRHQEGGGSGVARVTHTFNLLECTIYTVSGHDMLPVVLCSWEEGCVGGAATGLWCRAGKDYDCAS